MSPSDRVLPSVGPRRSLAASVGFHLARWLPLAGAALVGYVAFPPPAVVVTALPQVGQVAERTVVAPFSFETRKSSEEIASEGESRALSVRPVYRYSPTAYDSALGAARSFFAELERAERQGPDLLRAVAAARANLAPAETAHLTVESERRRIQAIVTHFLAETLSRGVADAGVLRGEPARQVSLRRGEG
jgi:membrane-associated HD superfamily phosphohydrolase